MPPYNPPSNTFYSEVPIPMYINPVVIIGRGGRKLKYITEDTGCQYIWVDIRRSVVEIWGQDESLPMAISKIRRLIHKILAKTLLIPDEYYNLPRYIKDNLTVYSWKSGCLTMYEIVGPEKLTLKFLDIIYDEYPYNPYVTRICKKTSGGIIVERFTHID